MGPLRLRRTKDASDRGDVLPPVQYSPPHRPRPQARPRASPAPRPEGTPRDDSGMATRAIAPGKKPLFGRKLSRRRCRLQKTASRPEKNACRKNVAAMPRLCRYGPRFSSRYFRAMRAAVCSARLTLEPAAVNTVLSGNSRRTVKSFSCSGPALFTRV